MYRLRVQSATIYKKKEVSQADNVSRAHTHIYTYGTHRNTAATRVAREPADDRREAYTDTNKDTRAKEAYAHPRTRQQTLGKGLTRQYHCVIIIIIVSHARVAGESAALPAVSPSLLARWLARSLALPANASVYGSRPSSHLLFSLFLGRYICRKKESYVVYLSICPSGVLSRLFLVFS